MSKHDQSGYHCVWISLHTGWIVACYFQSTLCFSRFFPRYDHWSCWAKAYRLINFWAHKPNTQRSFGLLNPNPSSKVWRSVTAPFNDAPLDFTLDWHPELTS